MTTLDIRIKLDQLETWFVEDIMSYYGIEKSSAYDKMKKAGATKLGVMQISRTKFKQYIESISRLSTVQIKEKAEQSNYGRRKTA